MKVIEGHLTATDKKAIAAITANTTPVNGQFSGMVGRAAYSITCEGEVYTVVKKVKDRGLVPVAGSALRMSRYTSKFIL